MGIYIQGPKNCVAERANQHSQQRWEASVTLQVNPFLCSQALCGIYKGKLNSEYAPVVKDTFAERCRTPKHPCSL